MERRQPAPILYIDIRGELGQLDVDRILWDGRAMLVCQA